MNCTRYFNATVLIALAILIAGCGNPTADKTAAEVTEAIAIEPEPTTAEGEPVVTGVVYAFTEECFLDFEGYKVTGPHEGGFSKMDGTVTIPDGNIAQAQIRLTVDVTSITSDDPILTKTLRGEKFFQVETYPEAHFISTAIEEYPDGSYGVTGNLELHGVTKGVTFPTTINLDGDTLTAEAEFTINRFDWNLVYEGLAGDLIRKDVLMYFDIEAVASEE